MERLQRGYIALKGFAIAIAMGLLVYLVCLAERYVEAVEMEKRYYIPGGESEFEFRVDRKEGTIQMWNGERYEILR
jgi:hypothetical protein